jgi:hypothetical protein
LDERLIDIIHILEDEKNETPKNLLDILVFNNYEDMLSKCHYDELFTYMLKLCGYNLKKQDKAMGGKCPKQETIDYEKTFTEIRTLSTLEFETIGKKIKGKCANEDEKKMFNKKCFLYKFKADVPIKILSELYFEIYCDSYKKQFINNVYYSKNRSIPELMLHDLDDKEGIFEMQTNVGAKLVYIEVLNDFMGLKHCQDDEVLIYKKDITEKVNPYLLLHYHNLCRIFKLKQKEIPTNERKKNAFLYYLLQDIYKNYGGCHFASCQIDNKKNSMKNCILAGYNFYDYIQITKKNKTN